MLARAFVRALLTASLVACWAHSGAAQPLGSFRWQAQPFCNVITVTIVQVGTVFALDGFDDQCGAPTRASVVGTAFFNLDGSVGIGLTTIATPGGAPVHMDVALSLATLGGPWRDSAGNLGTFAFTPGSGTGGTPRPIGRGIGAAAIDPTQVQRRVTGACAAGSVVRGINEDGTVSCEPGGGDITAVTAGSGLTGGASSGQASLAVNFDGDGGANAAARSDHEHRAVGVSNTVVGGTAFFANSSGSDNTAVGAFSLLTNTTGSFNTAIGRSALNDSSTGNHNTAIGMSAGRTNTGSRNTFVGFVSDTSGSGLFNASAFGAQAVVSVSNAMVLGSIAGMNGATSNVNVGIGTTTPAFPLQVVSTDGRSGWIQVGSNNVFAPGEFRTVAFGDGGIVRVGEEEVDDRLTLSGFTVRFKNASDVAPSSNGTTSLGLAGNRWSEVHAVNGVIQTSDARLKESIEDLGYGLSTVLNLRPVSFHWKGSAGGPPNLGLLAQDVEHVIPEAVVHGSTPDEPLGMNYSTLIPVLIKAIQDQHARIVALERQLQSPGTAR